MISHSAVFSETIFIEQERMMITAALIWMLIMYWIWSEDMVERLFT